MTTPFVHLRIHTEYSLIDGLTTLQPLIAEATRCQMPAVAITDHNNLFGAVKFYQEAVRAKIKPIMGADISIANEEQSQQPFLLTLLCQNAAGYQNLMELISRGYTDGQVLGQPTIKREWLKKYSNGLIALSGAEQGELGQALLADDKKNIHALTKFYQDIFPDRFYLELRRTGRAHEERYIQAALQLAEQTQLPVVATNDVRFLEASDFEAHEARVCIHEGHVLADPRRPKRYSDQQYFKSSEEMAALFADIPAALTNSVEIAKRCNVRLTLGKNFLPKFPVPEGFTTETYLVDVAQRGLEERLHFLFDNSSEEYRLQKPIYDARLHMELNVINKMGFAGYFLIVADFTRWARNNQVPVGPGRGSGPGSLVAFALKITDLDPLAHDLLFERFLNPERVSMPDFDIDFCMEGRDRVIDYVMDTHGHESVAQIITYGTMAARAVVRDVGRVLGMSYGHVDKLAKLIPFEVGMTLDKAFEQEVLLKERYEKEDDVRTLMDLAKKLEGITRNVGKHAGGVVIAPGKLTEFTALFCESEHPEHLVTQYDKDDVESVGLVKFDFLGLRTLTIIHHAVQNIQRLQPELSLDMLAIPMDDAVTFALLKACKTTAIFQLESRGMKDLVKRLQPDCFEDIVALVALFRPGPLQSGMVDDFINRKHGRAQVLYPHPKLEPILRPTYGVILYQEQVMQIAQVLAGYSLGAADLLRRAMGKKKPEEMAKQREIFCKGAVANSVPQETAAHIFDLMEKFAGYGFNKSHSASYALISYQTAWLKAHYPAAYMAAVLSSDMDNTDKIVHFIDECHQLQLTIAPPDINHSDYTFNVLDEKNLAYGLGAIKGAGQAAIEIILETRKQAPFKSLFDFCERVDLRKVNRRVIEALIKCGAFDSIGTHRASIMASLNSALQHAEQILRDQAQGQHDLLGESHSKSQTQTYIATPEWSDQVRLQGEKETLGHYISGHPIYRHLDELKNFTSCRIAELHPSFTKNPTIAGMITSVKTVMTKRGDRMAILTIEDGSAQIDIVCFSEPYQKYRELLQKDLLITVQGEIGMDDFTNQLRILAREIYSLDQARERFAKFLQIRFANKDANDLPQLAKLLEKHRGGNCWIKIHYQQESAAAHIQLGEQWRVKPSESLLTLLRETYRDDNVVMVY